MIPARPRPILGALVRRLLRRRLRAGVDAVRALGLEQLEACSARGPILLAGNHVAFWDGFVCALLSERLGVEPRVLMGAEGLRGAPLLRWTGAFGVEPDDPRDGARAVGYAARFLDRPGRALWIFPQGRQRPQWELPLRFRGGASAIARRAPQAALVPFALHYEVAERERPEVWIHFGAPLSDPLGLESAVIEGLEAVRAAIRGGLEVPSLLRARRRLGEGPASRLLARLLRPGGGPGALDRRRGTDAV